MIPVKTFKFVVKITFSHSAFSLSFVTVSVSFGSLIFSFLSLEFMEIKMIQLKPSKEILQSKIPNEKIKIRNVSSNK